MEFTYGKCPICGTELEPIFFIEYEYETIRGNLIKTGRKRRAVSHLECPYCFHKECVDDTFDGVWHR